MTDDDSTTTLQLAVAADAAGYLRHECPSCMLEFKLKGDEARFTDVLGWWASKAAAEHRESQPQPQDEGEQPVMCCPYCAHASRAQEFLHGEHQMIDVN